MTRKCNISPVWVFVFREYPGGSDWCLVTESAHFGSAIDTGDTIGKSRVLLTQNVDNGSGQPTRFSAAQEGIHVLIILVMTLAAPTKALRFFFFSGVQLKEQ